MYVVHSNEFTAVSENHDLVFGVCLAVFPVVDVYALRLRSILLRYVKHPAPRPERVFTLPLLPQWTVVASVVRIQGHGAGIEPCCTAAGGAGEGVEH